MYGRVQTHSPRPQSESLSQFGRTSGGHSAACSNEACAMTIKITAKWLPPETFPRLNRLALSDEELGALTRQGFIRSERRGGKTIFRLRFRVRCRQHARYVSPRDVAALEAELALLQKWVRAHRRLTGIAARGYHFHGHQIRRCRNAK
jgi:hypothetical protein